MTTIFISTWIFLAMLIGVVADKLGRDGPKFCFLALGLSPLVATIALLVRGKSGAGPAPLRRKSHG
jgi:biotin transporter BioY